MEPACGQAASICSVWELLFQAGERGESHSVAVSAHGALKVEVEEDAVQVGAPWAGKVASLDQTLGEYLANLVERAVRPACDSLALRAQVLKEQCYLVLGEMHIDGLELDPHNTQHEFPDDAIGAHKRV